ncbi:tetraspanin-8-like [Melanotaenia boesemani]|uniref:tetraspanin-8-like n=1 Tax=Melanotaenia boesemani TaxID=1250792 RepID=UPI001C03FFBF|nr:tetraspanin-8-like [Melanotaenia boesemani]
MGKVNVWLKRSYICLLSVMGILSLLLLGFTLFGHGHEYKDGLTDETTTGLHFLYGISAVILVFVMLGLFGIQKQKTWALIVFAVGITLGCLFMLVIEILGLATKAAMAKELTRNYLSIMPLVNATISELEDFDETQIHFQCCGMDQGYLDWGYNIPESCLCAEESTNPCVAAPRNSKLFKGRKDDQPVMIYSKPCIQYLVEHDMSYIQITLGTMLGITLLWVLSVVLCIIILCQMNRKTETPTVVYSKEAKAGNYCNLVEGSDAHCT